MAMGNCRECGKDVSTEAKTCPHCGVENPGVSVPQQPKKKSAFAKPCKSCGKDINPFKDKTCPHCGVKNPGTTGKDVFFGIVGAAVVLFLMAQCSGDGDGKSAAAVDPNCANDLKCVAEKGLFDAGYDCSKMLEKLAKYDFKWEDGTFDPKFSKYMWLNKELGHVSYFGDKLKLQNGFGAWQNYLYQCDYDTKTKTVLNVAAEPGKF